MTDIIDTLNIHNLELGADEVPEWVNIALSDYYPTMEKQMKAKYAGRFKSSEVHNGIVTLSLLTKEEQEDKYKEVLDNLNKIRWDKFMKKSAKYRLAYTNELIKLAILRLLLFKELIKIIPPKNKFTKQ